MSSKNPLGIPKEVLEKDKSNLPLKPNRKPSVQQKKRARDRRKRIFNDAIRYALLVALIVGAYFIYENTREVSVTERMSKEGKLLVKDKDIIEGTEYLVAHKKTHLGGTAYKKYPHKFVLICEGQKTGRLYFVETNNSFFYQTPRNVVLDITEVTNFKVFDSKDNFDAYYAAIEIDPNVDNANDNLLNKVKDLLKGFFQ